MCGIAGIWQRGGEPIDAGALTQMATILAHRGPDGCGAHIAGEIGLANRRLRILDLSEAADQPLGLADGRVWITFNGEIHNYLELRRELESRGASFRTRTDTEVALWAYAIWGVECFERFNGMWALALWDARHRQLVLSRDRFGIKPLYYSVRGARVCFASEAKAILAAFPQERQADHGEIERFLAGAYPDSGEATFFENVKNVLPATYLIFSRDQTRTAGYWTFTPGVEEPKPEAVDEFRELLADAVRVRTRSDVPVGACLSGGLDSSTVVSLVDVPGQVLHCFSTHYDEPDYDESRYAALVAKRRRLKVHWVRPHPRGMVETMRKIVWHHDAPTPVRGRFAEWFVMREAARHVKVVLAGHGSDELLAGYARDVLPYLIDRVRREMRVRPDLIREAVRLGRVGSSLHWFALTAMSGYLRDPRRRGARSYASTLNNLLWHGFRSHGLPESLHGDDALSMAFSLESRAPFLDHRIVELCFSLPFHDKIADGWTKALLRRSMTDVLPEEILARRRKLGFQAPVASWLCLDDNWLAVRELLLDRRSGQRGMFDRRRLELELAAFHRGSFRYTRMRVSQVWRWITLELWFREFLDGAGLIVRKKEQPAGLSQQVRAAGL
jgi:asparagine synthase (glutamine-hydrolysing)